MQFYEKLQKLRKEKGMSQENLAEVLNVSRQAISKWESGSSYPEMEKLIALSEMFGITLDDLVKDSDMNETKQNDAYEPFWLYRGSYYEYKSKRTWRGLPLVHVNIGRGFKKAKGIIAIGNIATGIISIGLFSRGLLSFGLASAGLISLGTFSLGALLSVGAISVGTISVGAVAVGVFTFGALSVGMFSIGACSVASHIAIGNYANGHIAIGETVNGIKTIEVEATNKIFTSVSKGEVRALINSEFQNLWKGIANFYVGLFK